MSAGVEGALLGLLAVSGLWLAVMSSPPMRRPRLDDRLAPYLRDTAQPSRLLGEERGVTPFPTLERLLGPVVRDLAARVDRVLGGAASVRRRLDQAGGDLTLEQFRVEQVLWGAGGLVVGVVVAILAELHGSRANPVG
jgi:tight adherence protein C